jgi:signal transduction histidine kinase
MHELRTPANAIAGFAEMIERQMLGEVAPVYRGRAAVIRDHARALLAAIEDLDIAARIEASALQLHPGEVALRPLLCRIVEDLGALAEARNASVTLPSDDAIAAADARAVERLVSRLLATLLSAAGEGERVEVSLGAGEDFVSLSATRPRALLAYADEALFAIDDEHEDAALLGTGFALRLLRNLARELSGSLVVEAGALTVRLPASVTKSLEVMR